MGLSARNSLSSVVEELLQQHFEERALFVLFRKSFGALCEGECACYGHSMLDLCGYKDRGTCPPFWNCGILEMDRICFIPLLFEASSCLFMRLCVGLL